MTEHEIITARVHAAYIAERMSAAYWVQDEQRRKYLLEKLPAELKLLAAAMGYDLVERADPLVETLATEKADVHNV